LTKSINFLSFLFPANPSLIEEVVIEVGNQDLEYGDLLELLGLQEIASQFFVVKNL
jgi:hypothetical protein